MKNLRIENQNNELKLNNKFKLNLFSSLLASFCVYFKFNDLLCFDDSFGGQCFNNISLHQIIAALYGTFVVLCTLNKSINYGTSSQERYILSLENVQKRFTKDKKDVSHLDYRYCRFTFSNVIRRGILRFVCLSYFNKEHYIKFSIIIKLGRFQKVM